MKTADRFRSRLIAAGIMMLACSAHVPHAIAQETGPVEAMSFGGQPIYRTQLPAELTTDALEHIAHLEAQTSRSEMDYIRLGELNAGIGRFQDAISAFSRGLEAYPDSYRLRRHRGHRLINVRALDRAIIDLAEALELMPETPTSELRPSGEAYGTYQHWIWYHVGLFHYLSGDYAQAADAYENAVLTAEGGLVVGSTDWLWNAAMRAGDEATAAAALSRLPDEIPETANRAYAQRVQLYQGLVDPEDILDVDKPEWTGGDITVAYGVANWHAFQGETEAADRIYRRIVDTPFWSAWAFVAAERELTR